MYGLWAMKSSACEGGTWAWSSKRIRQQGNEMYPKMHLNEHQKKETWLGCWLRPVAKYLMFLHEAPCRPVMRRRREGRTEPAAIGDEDNRSGTRVAGRSREKYVRNAQGNCRYLNAHFTVWFASRVTTPLLSDLNITRVAIQYPFLLSNLHSDAKYWYDVSENW